MFKKEKFSGDIIMKIMIYTHKSNLRGNPRERVSWKSLGICGAITPISLTDFATLVHGR